MSDVLLDAPALEMVSALEAQRIHVRDLMLICRVGVTARERNRPQRVRINLEAEVLPSRPLADDVSRVVDYGWLVERIRHVCEGCSDKLVETLADRIADACFRHPKVLATRIRVEKVDLYADAVGVGIEIERRRR